MLSPDVVTYNTLLDGARARRVRLGAATGDGEQARAEDGGGGSLLRAQDSVSEALRVWAWGNKQGIRRDARAWHHLVEAHIRHGRPGRTEALLGLHRREIKSPLSVESHNLHLRALVAAGEPQRALDHFERMLGQRKRAARRVAWGRAARRRATDAAAAATGSMRRRLHPIATRIRLR